MTSRDLLQTTSLRNIASADIYKRKKYIRTLKNEISSMNAQGVELIDEYNDEVSSGFYKGIELIGESRYDQLVSDGLPIPLCGELIHALELSCLRHKMETYKKFEAHYSEKLNQEIDQLEEEISFLNKSIQSMTVRNSSF